MSSQDSPAIKWVETCYNIIMVLSVDELLNLAGSPSPEDKLIAAKSRRTPADTLVEFTRLGGLSSDYWVVGVAALENKAYPDDERKNIALGSQKNLLWWEALRAKFITTDFLREVHTRSEELFGKEPILDASGAMISRHFSNAARILEHPNCPSELFDEYVSNEEPYYRKIIVDRKNLTEELMLRLAKDTDLEVRKTLAKKRGLTEPVVTILGGDSESPVRNALVRNKYVPGSWLLPMVERERYLSILLAMATKHPAELQDGVVKRLERVRKPSYSAATLLVLWSDNVAVLNRLCYSQDISVRRLAVNCARADPEAKVAAVLLGV